MERNRWRIYMKTAWIGLLVAILTAAHVEAAGRKDAPGRLPAEDLFKDEYIPRVRLELTSESLDNLRQRPRKYVTATVREGNDVFTNVCIRLKGGPGSFRPLEDKPAFTLNFERLADGQKFHGLKKIHLNNSVQDSTFLSEKISRELFEAAGVPAPRAGHATVEFNGRRLGLYVLVEGINKQFLRRYFKDPNGNLYDGHSQSEVTRVLRTNSGENRQEHSRLQALAGAAQEPDLTTRLSSLEQTLDLDRFISFLAMEVMICHWDGYALNRNNFRIYHDREKDRMVFLPQGVDQVFQRQNTSIFPPMTGLVARSVLEIPETRQRYNERVVQLLTNVFQVQVITNRISAVAAKIQPVLAEIDPQTAASYPKRVASFCRRIQQRIDTLERQLLSPSPAVKIDNGQSLPLAAWQPKIDAGSPSLTREQNEGKTLLHIRAEESCAASWRSRVLLESGQYRLEGKVKTQGVKLSSEDPKAGAGLRISRRHFSRKVSENMDWTTAGFDFEVQQNHSDVELVCELRATQGEVWFDLASLRLLKR
jgi:spore coat protein H